MKGCCIKLQHLTETEMLEYIEQKSLDGFHFIESLATGANEMEGIDEKMAE